MSERSEVPGRENGIFARTKTLSCALLVAGAYTLGASLVDGFYAVRYLISPPPYLKAPNSLTYEDRLERSEVACTYYNGEGEPMAVRFYGADPKIESLEYLEKNRMMDMIVYDEDPTREHETYVFGDPHQTREKRLQVSELFNRMMSDLNLRTQNSRQYPLATARRADIDGDLRLSENEVFGFLADPTATGEAFVGRGQPVFARFPRIDGSFKTYYFGRLGSSAEESIEMAYKVAGFIQRCKGPIVESDSPEKAEEAEIRLQERFGLSTLVDGNSVYLFLPPGLEKVLDFLDSDGDNILTDSEVPIIPESNNSDVF